VGAKGTPPCSPRTEETRIAHRPELETHFRATNSRLPSPRLRDLDQVAAGVVEDSGAHRAHLGRLLRELDAECPQPLELLVQVVDGAQSAFETTTIEKSVPSTWQP
jgi:hypothetical protein